MAYPVTLNGRTYTLTDFEGTNYVEGLPDAFEDFVTHAGNLYSTTSTTSNTIGTGSKTFTVESSKPYQVGTPLRITDSAAPATNWMDAIVTAYSGTTLTVDAAAYAGSGTLTSWNINIGGGGTSYTGTLPVAQGGTGATTASDARTNLDVYSKADADSRFLNVSGEASNVTMTGDVTIGDAASDTLTVAATAAFDTNTLYVDATNSRTGIGTISPGTKLVVEDEDATLHGSAASIDNTARIIVRNQSPTTGSYSSIALHSENAGSYIGQWSLASVSTATNFQNDLVFHTRTGSATHEEKMRILNNGYVGIGTSAPTSRLMIEDPNDISMNTDGTGHFQIDGNGYDFAIALDADAANLYTNSGSRDIVLGVNETEIMRVGSSHTFFGGKTSTAVSDYGAVMEKVNSSVQLSIHRQSSDGKYIEFYRGGSNGGGIFSDGGNTAYTSGSGSGLMMRTSDIIPTNGSGVAADNTEDMGDALYRFDDVFATNGTIQTSDVNEKQQITSMTDAEIVAAKAISKLFKTFKWNSAVEAKGDAARTHSGVIAQDVEQAMTDAGLNAGDYAFFINSTWWETQTEVPAVAADEEKGVEAQEAYTRIDTYETAEEAPEGATERTRKGIRYPELLSFIGAATEQRLASIEARLDALES